MTLRPTNYRDRLIDARLREALTVFGAVSLEGPKWCGKTWSALAQAESVFYVADAAGGFANRQLAQLDPAGVLEGAAPRLIDEWQEVAHLWDAVRFAVDQAPAPGRLLLTGSATPADSSVIHSGAGRIGRIRLRTMSLAESGDSTAAISLSGVLNGEPVRPAASTATLESLSGLILRGGWPAAVGLNRPSFTPEQGQMLARDYIETIARVDISRLNGQKRDPTRVQALLASLARNTATLVSNATIRRDLAERLDASASDNTVREYLTLLTRLYLLEEIPAWSPNVRSRTRLRVAGKRMLTDPSLAAAALGLSTAQLRNDPNTLGFLFENLCLRDLLVYGQLWGATVSHYRDETGLEADAILTLPDGRWAGFEIKLGHHQIDQAASQLLRLADKMAAGGLQQPAALAVICGVGAIAQRRDDGVYVLPIDQLGP